MAVIENFVVSSLTRYGFEVAGNGGDNGRHGDAAEAVAERFRAWAQTVDARHDPTIRRSVVWALPVERAVAECAEVVSTDATNVVTALVEDELEHIGFAADSAIA
jgi:hypothetical protein